MGLTLCAVHHATGKGGEGACRVAIAAPSAVPNEPSLRLLERQGSGGTGAWETSPSPCTTRLEGSQRILPDLIEADAAAAAAAAEACCCCSLLLRSSSSALRRRRSSSARSRVRAVSSSLRSPAARCSRFSSFSRISRRLSLRCLSFSLRTARALEGGRQVC